MRFRKGEIMRSMKVGLTVLMTLAITAIAGAASASAGTAGFVADTYPVVANGNNVSTGVLTTNQGEATCKAQNFASTVSNAGEALTAPVNGTTCSWWGTNRPVAMNGCKYIFHPGTETEPGVFKGTYDIGPAGCGPITVEASNGCTLSISSQNGLNATYVNSGSGSSRIVTIQADTDFIYTASGGFCGKGSTEGGHYKSSWQVAGQVGANQVGIKAAKQNGLYMTGAQSIAAEGYADHIVSQASALSLETQFGEVGCTSSILRGELAAATATLPLAAELSGCNALGFKGTATMNSCHFVVNVSNTGSPYKGTVDIACTSPGDSIRFAANGGLCTVSVPAQSGLEGLSLATTGSGSDRRVVGTANLKGVQHHGDAGFCVGEEEESATLKTTFSLAAFDSN